MPGRFETTQQLVEGYADVFLYNLGAEYYSRLPEVYSGVRLEDVRAAAARYFAPGEQGPPDPPEKMVAVAVGDLARIEPELRELDLGPIEIRESDGSVRRNRE